MVQDDPGFAVYVHWPFCQSKCPYCDFNSHVRQNGIDEAGFLEAYLKELDYVAQLSPGHKVHSVFFGGGTPSLMQPDTVHSLISHIDKLWGFKDNIEITLEANPSSVEAARFAGYRKAGVNRVSLGIQTFNDKDLKALGRLHSVQEAEAALDIAFDNFERVSFDLIYARPHQSPQEWKEELEYALNKPVQHLSLYQLTIEPGTRFADLYKAGKLTIPQGEIAEEHYFITQDLCEKAGLPAYEISNHAQPGQECQHNLVYWQYGSYAGIGPGAHGRISIDNVLHATSTQTNPEIWQKSVLSDGHGMTVNAPLSLQQQADELLLMGLRLKGGMNLEHLNRLTGYVLDFEQLQPLMSENLIDCYDQKLYVTQKGRFVLNHVIGHVAESLLQ